MLSNPFILTDKSRLPELYNFRVRAWEDSPGNIFINYAHFPNGWYDRLDNNAVHWIIENENTIIASARIAIVNDLHEMDEDFSSFNLPESRPFAFFSRLAIHENFRKKGIAEIMDKVRMEYIEQMKISFIIAYATKKRVGALEKLGFNKLGVGLIAKKVTPTDNEFRDIGLIWERNAEHNTR